MSIYRVDIINGLIVRLSPADAQEGVSVGNVCRASDWHERERGLRRPLFRLQVEGLDMPVVTIVGPGVVGTENRGMDNYNFCYTYDFKVNFKVLDIRIYLGIYVLYEI